MKTLLICPADRPAVAFLSLHHPLVLAPILGKGLVVWWLEHLATLGAKHVRVLAADRPEQVRAAVGDGSRWGLRVEVVPVQDELNVDEARLKYRGSEAEGWMTAPHDVVMLDQLPGQTDYPLFNSYVDWLEAVSDWMPLAVTPDRIGLREVQPGVWIGLHAHVSPQAVLRAPCWIGSQASIGPDCLIGPMAVIEDRAFVESGADISQSVVGPDTFIGKLTEVRGSLAFGNHLLNWQTGSSVQVSDPFVMCALSPELRTLKPTSWIGRAAALAVMTLTLPLALFAILKAKWQGRPPLAARRAVIPGEAPGIQPVVFHEITGAGRWLRRWPELASIVRGEFAWFGNRPLDRLQASSLVSEFERLWLAAPTGLLSLADANDCRDTFDDETRAHASYYAVHSGWRLNWFILRRVLRLILSCKNSPGHAPDSSTTPERPSPDSNVQPYNGVMYENPTSR